VQYLFHVLIVAEIYCILSLSLSLIVGYTGLPALGHAAFFAVGAYASSLFCLNLGLSPWLGMLLGAILALLLGVVVALPSLRLLGDYFALATFGLGLVVYYIVRNWASFTRGPMGLPNIPKLTFFGLRLGNVYGYFLVSLGFLLVTVTVVHRIVNSPFGRVLKSIREDETGSQALGKNTSRNKLIVCMTGALFAGVAGSLYAHYVTFIAPESFTFLESITILLMVILGGMGSITGSILGGIILVLFPELLRFVGMPSSVAAPMRQILYGLLLVLLMIWRPQGLLGTYRFK